MNNDFEFGLYVGDVNLACEEVVDCLKRAGLRRRISTPDVPASNCSVLNCPGPSFPASSCPVANCRQRNDRWSHGALGGGAALADSIHALVFVGSGESLAEAAASTVEAAEHIPGVNVARHAVSDALVILDPATARPIADCDEWAARTPL